MGIAALRKVLFPGSPPPFDVALLRGRTLAVDADNLIWSFVTALATSEVPRAPDGRPVAHLLGLLSRMGLYAKWGARAVWVFDGAQPALKQATLQGRADRIDAARAAGTNPQAMAAVTEEDLAECRALLAALGVPWVVAPGESDAQCAHLVRAGHAWAAVTQDWDIALFGAPRALRNLTQSAARAPEILELAPALAAAGLTLRQLVDAAILIGTDYNEGVRGVGPVKAVQLVRHGTLEEALAKLGVALPELAAVRALYFDHPVDRSFTPVFAPPDLEAALDFGAGRGLSARRIEAAVAALRALPHAHPA